MAPVLSLNPTTFVEGGLIDDVDGKIVDAKFTMYDYNGTVAEPVPSLGIEIELTDGTKHESYYSAGDAKYWAPSEDGKTLIPTGDKAALTKSSKLGLFLTELINAGYPADKLGGGDISVLVGLQAHFIRKADPTRTGLVRTGKNADRAASTLCVAKIIAMPGETPKAAPKAAAKGAPTQAAATTPAVDVDEPSQNVLIELLSENNGSIKKAQVSQLAFKKIGKDHPNFAQRTPIMQRVFNDEFLKAGVASGLWAFDGQTISMG